MIKKILAFLLTASLLLSFCNAPQSSDEEHIPLYSVPSHINIEDAKTLLEGNLPESDYQSLTLEEFEEAITPYYIVKFVRASFGKIFAGLRKPIRRIYCSKRVRI